MLHLWLLLNVMPPVLYNKYIFVAFLFYNF